MARNLHLYLGMNANAAEKIRIAIEMLREAGVELVAEGEVYYNNGDILRGNICNDNGNLVISRAADLYISVEHVARSLAKQ